MKICILGGGHMGTWLADALAPGHEVSLFDPDPSKTTRNRKVAVLESLAAVGDRAPDLLINAVSLQNTITAFMAVSEYLPEECLLCDIASVKGELPAWYASQTRKFVSVHPMFGPTFARMEDLQGENAVIITESDQQGTEFWRTFFTTYGVHVYDYSFADHDPMMAYSLTLPFVSSLVFSSCVSMKAVPGTTFRRHLEVASGLLGEDDYLLTEILFNRESLGQLEKISGRLNHLRHIIDQRDSEEARKFIGSLRSNLLPENTNPENGS